MTRHPTQQRQLKVLRDYAAGLLDTRRAIEKAGEDYAELVIALAKHDLDLPRPADTAKRQADIERARAILQPLLRNVR
ncbi:MAG: hypothetical protein JO071_16115 [Deltaproteobacteria bacterium]|nr:hypothetical protein [Deltaproteobacteria bacterium]